MTRLVSEREVEEAFTAWARDSLTATTARSLSVAALESHQARAHRSSRSDTSGTRMRHRQPTHQHARGSPRQSRRLAPARSLAMANHCLLARLPR
jgi:hypothetical protein